MLPLVQSFTPNQRTSKVHDIIRSCNELILSPRVMALHGSRGRLRAKAFRRGGERPKTPGTAGTRGLRPRERGVLVRHGLIFLKYRWLIWMILRNSRGITQIYCKKVKWLSWRDVLNFLKSKHCLSLDLRIFLFTINTNTNLLFKKKKKEVKVLNFFG